MRMIGTRSLGIRTPIVKEGDDIVKIVVDSIMDTIKYEGVTLKNMDVIGITESLVARAQGNFANIDVITKDINNKFPDDIGVVFPILSRNRFSLVLKAIANTNKKVHVLLSYPYDEVGNCLMDIDKMEELNINPYSDILTEKDYRKLFGKEVLHEFTGIDYVKLYKSLGDNINIYLSNNPLDILKYTKNILVSNVHDRFKTKEKLINNGAKLVLTLDDILTESIDESGYNPEYGLLGCNLASDEEIKLFPRDSKKYVTKIQEELFKKTNALVEVMVYGDGAFKDPVCGIWELADPVVSPGFTDGLIGTPNEIKLKYIVDTELKDLDEEETLIKIKKKIYEKKSDKLNEKEALGTTPRRLVDLLGSLSDLTSGSGDKGTPVVLIQGYFDNYSDE